MFPRYILVCLSLWYDEKTIFRFERDYAAHSKDLAARVFSGVGSHENQPWNNRAMVDDIKDLIEMLRSHGYPGLDISSHIFENETHNSPDAWFACCVFGPLMRRVIQMKAIIARTKHFFLYQLLHFSAYMLYSNSSYQRRRNNKIDKQRRSLQFVTRLVNLVSVWGSELNV